MKPLIGGILNEEALSDSYVGYKEGHEDGHVKASGKMPRGSGGHNSDEPMGENCSDTENIHTLDGMNILAVVNDNGRVNRNATSDRLSRAQYDVEQRNGQCHGI